MQRLVSMSWHRRAAMTPDQCALGVFVEAGKGSPVIAQATKRGQRQTKFGSVFCNDGDVVLAVRWLVRKESDAERRTFYEPSDEDDAAGSVIPANSKELRHAGFGLIVLEPSIRTAWKFNAELETSFFEALHARVEFGDNLRRVPAQMWQA
jgi:hypothetical protein